MPVAATLKVTLLPTKLTWLTGAVVICAGLFTNRVALFVTVRQALATTTE